MNLSFYGLYFYFTEMHILGQRTVNTQYIFFLEGGRVYFYNAGKYISSTPHHTNTHIFAFITHILFKVNVPLNLNNI